MSETDDKKLDEQIEKINQTEADLLRAMEIQEQMKDFVATAGQSKPADEKTASEADVVEALKTVCDPEIMINVYDMGLIYNIEIRDNGDVFIAMTLTAPGCPVAGAKSKYSGFGAVNRPRRIKNTCRDCKCSDSKVGPEGHDPPTFRL